MTQRDSCFPCAARHAKRSSTGTTPSPIRVIDFQLQ
jgi:hypothetical protein